MLLDGHLKSLVAAVLGNEGDNPDLLINIDGAS